MDVIKPASVDAAYLFHEGTLALAQMEANGIRVDVDYLKKHTLETEEEIADLHNKLLADKMWRTWERKFGNKATLGNRVQLGEIVFGDMKYKRRHSLTKKDRKDGYESERRTPKNDEAAFGDAVKDLPFVADYFRWLKLSKMHGTYLLGFQREVVNGRIHPFYHLHKVRSYRSSSSEPNFTNIPVRNREIGDRLRKCFIPDEGCDLGEFDYGGAEVRSACCYTGDPRLIEEFTGKGKDPHGDTAMELFGIKREHIKPLEHFTAKQKEECKKLWEKGPRDWAKNRFVFPQFFGSVAFQCAPHLWEAVEAGAMMPHGDISVREHLRRQGITHLGNCDPDADIEPGSFLHRCKVVEDGFWKKRFKVYDAWKRRWWNSYCTKGYFESLSGFVFSGLYGKNDCLNYGIQAFAFHWLLYAVIRLTKLIKKYRMKSKLVGEIHDSLLINVPANEVDVVFPMVADIMRDTVPRHWPSIIVPLKVEADVVHEGLSWADKVKIEV